MHPRRLVTRDTHPGRLVTRDTHPGRLGREVYEVYPPREARKGSF